MKEKTATVKPTRRINPFWIKVLALIIISTACVFGIYSISAQYRVAAEEVQKLKTQKFIASSGDQTNLLSAEIERYSVEIEAIENHFPDEEGILDLLVELQNMQDSGIITSFDFTSDLAVKDKFGLYGLPLSIVITGNTQIHNQALERIHNLPFLVRPILLHIEREQESDFVSTYGGFIYVNEEFPKTR